MIWTFQVIRGAKHEPVRAASVRASSEKEIFMTECDQAGRARLTLPQDGHKLTVYASPHSASLQSNLVVVEWDTQFSPDAVKAMNNRDGRFHLTDDAGKTATIVESDAVHPTIVDRKLVLQVTLPETDFKVIRQPDRPRHRQRAPTHRKGESSPGVRRCIKRQRDVR